MNYKEIFDISIDFGMAVFPCLSFFVQIFKIKKTQSSEGFSKIIILILLIANITRIVYWIGKPFSYVFLIQSILMILTQFYLLHICLKYSKNKKPQYLISRSTYGINQNLFNIKEFWDWSKFIDYVSFIILIIIILLLSTLFFGLKGSFYVDFLGALSGGIEALLGIPQILSNYTKKSTGSLSIGMILLWFLGDSIKSVYNFYKNSPIPLIYAGIIQLLSDVFIIIQIVYYSQRSDYKKNEEKTNQVLLSSKSTDISVNNYDELSKSESNSPKETSKIDDEMDDIEIV